MDKSSIGTLVANGSTSADIAKARSDAKAKYPSFPRLGCAAYLSSLMRNSGIDVEFTLGAGKLAHVLERGRGWKVVPVGSQAAGDVGICFDMDKKIAGSDHVYVVITSLNNVDMIISDNQDVKPHSRATFGTAKTPTEYFLRAT